MIRKTSEYIGKINCILFKPSDLDIFDKSPKERRRILDVELGKISSSYLNDLLRYNILLKDKNKLLKENSIDDFYLSLIEEQMTPLMKNIITYREEFFTYINLIINKIYQSLSGSSDTINIIYNKCCKQEDVEINSLKNKEKDLLYHYSVFGIHHDDFYFTFNGQTLNDIASQGQKRMAMISFKLALFRFVSEKINDVPIILLDDIFSELDKDNQRRLLEIIPDHTQIVITVTDLYGLNINRNFRLIDLKEDKKDG